MFNKILLIVCSIPLAFMLVGGTCSMPPPCDRFYGNCDQPRGGAPYLEEVTSLMRITNRLSDDCCPDLSPDGKWIVFQSYDRYNTYRVPSRNYTLGDFDIWIVGANGGSGFQRVTNNETDDYFPAWYPDGKRILFTSERSGIPNIWSSSVAGADGSQLLSWVGNTAFGGDVSPDGKFIVCCIADNQYRTITDLYRNLSYPKITSNLVNFNPYFANYQVDSRWHPHIYRMDMNGARLTDLGIGINPKVSPDGKKIVYSSIIGGTWDVWIMDNDGTNKTQITTYPGNEMSPCWSPDGKWVAYSKSSPKATPCRRPIDDEYYNIWVTNIETGENIQKTFSRWFRDLSPCWGYVDEGDHYRDYIYFHSDRDDFVNTGYDIYRLDPDMGVSQYDIPDLPKGYEVKVDKQKPSKEPRIQVLNSTNVVGWAEAVASQLKSEGCNVISFGNTIHEKNIPRSKIYYRPGFSDYAEELTKKLPGEQTIHPARWNMGEADITVVLGGVKK